MTNPKRKASMDVNSDRCLVSGAVAVATEKLRLAMAHLNDGEIDNANMGGAFKLMRDAAHALRMGLRVESESMKLLCEDCQGTGYLECPACNGAMYIHSDPRRSPGDPDANERPCSECRDTRDTINEGQVECAECKGVGTYDDQDESGDTSDESTRIG